MTGAPTFIAISMILQIFSALVSDSEPPSTVKSCAIDEHHAAVDRAVAGDAAVARDFVVFHAEIGAAMLDEHVVFLEGIGVEQDFQPLARGELALGVLRLDARRRRRLHGRGRAYAQARR